MRHSNVMFIASIVRPDNVTDVMPFWRGGLRALGRFHISFRPSGNAWKASSIHLANSIDLFP